MSSIQHKIRKAGDKVMDFLILSSPAHAGLEGSGRQL